MLINVTIIRNWFVDKLDLFFYLSSLVLVLVSKARFPSFMLSCDSYNSTVQECFQGNFVGGWVVQESFHVSHQVSHEVSNHIFHFGWIDKVFLHHIHCYLRRYLSIVFPLLHILLDFFEDLLIGFGLSSDSTRGSFPLCVKIYSTLWICAHIDIAFLVSFSTFSLACWQWSRVA